MPKPRKRPLARCAAVVDDFDHLAYYAPAQRIVAPGDKQCSKNAKESVGHLELCSVHARLAHEGLINQAGRVADRNTLRDYRRFPEKLGRLHSWTLDLQKGQP